MTILHLRAPAKINWTLEVMGRRPDGYHEVRTILQTIALSDTVALSVADELSLTLTGAPGPLADEPIEHNLAYRAAERLQRACGRTAGARIAVEKRVPVGAGLGGGSSDAAAVLRGLRKLWELSISDEDLSAIAAELGSDVPFFLHGGAALASGRGELLRPLTDAPEQRLVVAWPERAATADKTTRMYAALRPEHYSDGARTDGLATRQHGGKPIDEGDLSNTFEAVLARVDAPAAEAFERAAALGMGQPHLCGSGPAFFFLIPPDGEAAVLIAALEDLDLRAIETRTLSAGEALGVTEG